MFRMSPIALVLLAALSGPAAARDHAPPKLTAEEQQAMAAYQQAGAPGVEHARLAAQAGTYDLSVKSWPSPGAQPVTDTGTATRYMILGNRVLAEDVESQMMGQPYTGLGLHGYDNVTGKYWATWNDSMSTQLLFSEGTCDADGACTFIGHYHDPVTRQLLTTRITTRQVDADTELVEMYAPAPDGNEARMMEITYHRRGPQ